MLPIKQPLLFAVAVDNNLLQDASGEMECDGERE